jgi:hypothetical protein
MRKSKQRKNKTLKFIFSSLPFPYVWNSGKFRFSLLLREPHLFVKRNVAGQVGASIEFQIVQNDAKNAGHRPLSSLLSLDHSIFADEGLYQADRAICCLTMLLKSQSRKPQCDDLNYR